MIFEGSRSSREISLFLIERVLHKRTDGGDKTGLPWPFIHNVRTRLLLAISMKRLVLRREASNSHCSSLASAVDRGPFDV